MAAIEHSLLKTKRMIIIGMDGLDPNIVDSLLEAGKLPNFKRLKDKGDYRRLATTNPSQSSD